MARKKRAIDPALLLDGVPVPNGAVRTEIQERGLLLWVPIEKRWWMGPPLGYFLPFRNEKGIALDALGREIFCACDGIRTTEEIIEGFAKHHRLKFHDARLSVLSFLKSLVERKLVVLVAGKGQGR